MKDVLDHPTVGPLLAKADRTLGLLEALQAEGQEVDSYRRALDALYRDLGDAVHALHRGVVLDPPSDAAPEPLADDGSDPDELGPPQPTPAIAPPQMLQDEIYDFEDWRSEEITFETEVGHDAVATASGPEAARARAGLAADAVPVVTAVEAILLDADGHWSATALAQGDDSWLPALQDVLDLLDAPTEAAEPEDLALEAARLQWITHRVDQQWAPFPEGVKVALVGLLSSRARHVVEHLELDVGVRAALERLVRFRKVHNLQMVCGLVQGRQPEHGSWPEDARRWWRTLSAGLPA